MAVWRGLSVAPEDRWPSMEALLSEIGRDRTAPEPPQFSTTAISKLAGIWEPPMRGQRAETAGKEQIRLAFLATGKRYAATSFENASQILDQYTSSWVEMYAEACEATHVRREQSADVLDLRMAFLKEALEGLKALCQVFREANGDVVENALTAAAALPRIERCADIDGLSAAIRPPADPAARAAVDAMRTRLAQLRTLVNVGRMADANKAVAALAPEARRLGYGPLLAEILLLWGTIFLERGEAEEAAKASEEAVWTAELSHHDEVVAEAATQLVGLAGYGLQREVADVWARHAEMTLRRMGGHQKLWSWLLNNRAAALHKYGDLKGAIEKIQLAIAAKEKVFGSDHTDTAISIGNYALYLAESGDLDNAIVHAQRGVRILESREGPDHPRTAFYLYNYSEYLNLVGRFSEARDTARRALAVFERETEPNSLFISLTSLALGVAYLGDGLADEAVPLVERAVGGLESRDNDPARLGKAHFALASALSASARDLTRARELAVRARREYAQASASVLNARALSQIDAFLVGR
jgi:tetratricopeptide (TPR) repeat protein